MSSSLSFIEQLVPGIRPGYRSDAAVMMLKRIIKTDITVSELQRELQRRSVGFKKNTVKAQLCEKLRIAIENSGDITDPRKLASLREEEISSVQLGSYKKKALVAKLECRDIKTTGNKGPLAKRLVEALEAERRAFIDQHVKEELEKQGGANAVARWKKNSSSFTAQQVRDKNIAAGQQAGISGDDAGKKPAAMTQQQQQQQQQRVSKAKENDDWRVRAEEKRKAALELKAQKKKQRSAAATPKSPVTNPYKSPARVTPSNPYAMKAPVQTSSTDGTTNNIVSQSPAMSSPPAAAAAAATLPTNTANTHKPRIAVQQNHPTPGITSAWGDCRLDLWEAACTCGGERKAPDVRMCSCMAPDTAGLFCEGCNAGVLLIKDGPRGPFWGCSMYKKRGCKYTKKFGPPHDAKAAAQLAGMRRASASEAEREREEMSHIVDPYEADWRSVCRCGGAKELDTYECFMQSEGGCGMLPLCPQGCGGGLFLHQSKYGNGRWWGCSNYKNGACKFRKNYIEHK